MMFSSKSTMTKVENPTNLKTLATNETYNTLVELAKFKEFIGECRNFNPKDVKIVVKQFMWIWKILSKYETITYNPELKGNSANAKFCELQGRDTNGILDHPIFAKFQIGDEGDDMLADDINGFVLNKIFEQRPGFKDFYMEYIDSCISCAKYETQDGKENLFFRLEELNPSHIEKDVNCEDNYTLCQYYKRHTEDIVDVKVSFHKHIQGDGSLSDYIKKNYKDMSKLSVMLPKLFRSLRFVGENYGFTHNDAHLGNILVKKTDDGEESLVLIDYGRVLFNTTLPGFTSDMIEDIQSRITLEIVKHYDKDLCIGNDEMSYDDLMLALKNVKNVGLKDVYDDTMSGKTSSDPDMKYLTQTLYMFDIMTISMNIVLILCRIDNYKSDTFSEFLTMMDNGLITIEDPNKIYELFVKKTSKLHEKKLDYLIPGIFWFSFFVYNLWCFGAIASSYGTSNNPEAVLVRTLKTSINKKPDTQQYVVNITALSKMKIMHIYFQIIWMPKVFWSIFKKQLARWKDKIELILPNMSQAGGRHKKLRKTKVKPIKRAKLADMKFKKASSKHFKGYMGKHMIGGNGDEIYNEAVASVKVVSTQGSNSRVRNITHKSSFSGRSTNVSNTSNTENRDLFKDLETDDATLEQKLKIIEENIDVVSNANMANVLKQGQTNNILNGNFNSLKN